MYNRGEIRKFGIFPKDGDEKMNYTSVMLNNYSSLRTVIRQFDKIVQKEAMRSHFNGRQDAGSAYDHALKVVKYVHKKQKLIDLHNITTRAINSLNREDKTIIYFRFVLRAENEQMMKRFSFSQRTLYRRICTAQKSLQRAIFRQYFDVCRFLE